MMVSQLKQLEPLADTFELKAEDQYLVRLPKVSPAAVKMLSKQFMESGISKVIIVTGDNIEIYKMGEDPGS